MEMLSSVHSIIWYFLLINCINPTSSRKWRHHQSTVSWDQSLHLQWLMTSFPHCKSNADLHPKTTLPPPCSIWIQAAHCAVWQCCRTVCEIQSMQNCIVRWLHAVWSSRETTLNLDRGCGSSKYGFSVHVESPNMSQCLTIIAGFSN